MDVDMNIVFAKENYIYIIIFLLLFLGFIVLINVKNWDFNPNTKPPELIQEVVMETMQNFDVNEIVKDLKLSPADSFCETHNNDTSAQRLDDACAKMSKNRCLQTSCCVYYQDKCAAGSSHGPTYTTDTDGNSFEVDYYYYQNKCYGKCPK